jgi:hypothetical protein
MLQLPGAVLLSQKEGLQVRLSQATHSYNAAGYEDHGSRFAQPPVAVGEAAQPTLGAPKTPLHRAEPQPSGEGSLEPQSLGKGSLDELRRVTLFYLFALVHGDVLLFAACGLDADSPLLPPLHCMLFLIRQCHSLGQGL